MVVLKAVFLPDVLTKNYADIKINWGVLNLSSPYLPWLVKLPAGAVSNCPEQLNEPETPEATKSGPKSLERRGRSNSPSESCQLPDCKPLKTNVMVDSTSKRDSSSGGCETNCDIAPELGNESGMSCRCLFIIHWPVILSVIIPCSLFLLVFHRHHCLRRLLDRHRPSQTRNLSHMKGPICAISP